MARWKVWALAGLFGAIVFYGGAIWMGITFSSKRPGTPVNTFATYAVGDPLPALRYEDPVTLEKKSTAGFIGVIFFADLIDTDLAKKLSAKMPVLVLCDDKSATIAAERASNPMPFTTGRVSHADMRTQFPWLRQGLKPRAVMVEASGTIAELMTSREAVERLNAAPSTPGKP